MASIECGACGRIFDKESVKIEPTPAGCWWICPVCRQKQSETGAAIMFVLFCILVAAVIAWLILRSGAVNEYECRSYTECRQLCAFTEWHNHEIHGRGEVPSYISDHDMKLTGLLESGGK